MTVSAQKSVTSLFTFNFVLETDLTISNASCRLRELCPALEQSPHFLDIFTCHRPVGIKSIEDIADALDSLFLLITKDRKLAIKGQFIGTENCATLQFVGMPWLAWMNEKAPEIHLQLSDYPKLDSQMDQIFYATSQQAMVRDLEELTDKLISAERDAKDAIRIQSDLFAVMSHEMRTPLNAVIGALTLMSDEMNPDERSKLEEIAHESANNLLHVINYALDFSKLDAGKMKLDPNDFSLENLVSNVEAVTKSRAKIKSLQFTTQLDPNLPELIKGDEDKVKQILINLVSNSIKFTTEGQVSLSAMLSSEGDILFSVQDTGTGIESEDLGHIFEPFWGKVQGDSETSTGLGLNIVKRLVDLMSGRIEVDSTPGEGSNFKVYIPYEKAISHKKSLKRKMTPDSLPRHFKGNVLLVDDNATNLLLGSMLLEKHGPTVFTASNGQEAVDIANAQHLDLVLMDISMPVMDGIEATRVINSMLQAPPVIALTANVGKDVVDEYLSAGFKSYLSKPVDQDALLYELNMWLQADEKAIEVRVEPDFEVSNQNTLCSLVNQIGETKFSKVRQLFLEETQKRLGALLAAWVRRDLDALRLEAHTLSSSVGSFGCDELSWRFKHIEAAVKEKDVTEIIRYMKDIEKVSKETLQVVSDYQPNQRG